MDGRDISKIAKRYPYYDLDYDVKVIPVIII